MYTNIMVKKFRNALAEGGFVVESTYFNLTYLRIAGKHYTAYLNPITKEWEIECLETYITERCKTNDEAMRILESHRTIYVKA